MDIHIGFIMDGNRRYSKKQSIDLRQGYRKGMEKFLDMVRCQVKYNIYETSFFALSTDNYKKRPTEEKKILFELIKFFADNKDVERFFVDNKITLSLKGDLGELKSSESKTSKTNKIFINSLFKKIESWNSKIDKPIFKVNLALNYDGQGEILHSMKKIIEKIEKKEIKTKNITKETIKENLWFNESKPPEIIVRCGNAPRISGFMLWDSQYSEIYLTKKLWPEFDESDFVLVLEWFSSQKRNFGK